MWSFIRRLRRSDSTDDDATKALLDAEKNLEQVQKRSREVSDVAGALREIRKKNHFAEALEEILRPKGNLDDSA